MSHPPLEEPASAAIADEGSETDVESGLANDHTESASFLKAFNSDSHAPSYEDEQPSADTRTSSRRSRFWRLSFAFAPWILSLILLIVLIAEHVKDETSCYRGVKEQYTLAGDHTEYRTQVMYDGVDNGNPMSEYQGWPNDESDKLWDQFDGKSSAASACDVPELSTPMADLPSQEP